MSAVLTDWHRQQAASIAAAFPLTPTTPIRARGVHLAASNDEPEPPVPVAFEVAGRRFSLAEMVEANASDADFCAWAREARPGDSFPDGEGCQCVWNDGLAERDFADLDRGLDAWAGERTSGAADARDERDAVVTQCNFLRSIGGL